MNNTKVSVLISNFNKQKYLEECINSCLTQEYKNLEIIVYDNMSTDNSLNILKSYSDKINTKVKKRVSLIAAENQTDILIEAFKISSGEIICFLDSDDYFIPRKVSVIVQKFLQNQKLKTLFDIPRIKKKENIEPIKIKNKTNKYIWPSTIPTSGISLRRDFFKECLEVNLFTDYPRVEIDLKINFFSQKIKKDYLIIDDYLTFYREVSDGIMSSSKKFSKKWWLRRMEAHNFIKDIYQINNINYYRDHDFFITKLFSNFLKDN